MCVFGFPAGLIWDSEAIERAWSFTCGEVISVKIASVDCDSKMIALAPLKASNLEIQTIEFSSDVWALVIKPIASGFYVTVNGRPAVLRFDGVP